MRFKEKIVNLENKQCLSLCHENIEDDDAESLAQALKGTQIAELDLYNNKIGCNGLKHLSLVLKDLPLTRLVLRKNYIGDEGVKYLTEALIYTPITHLDLADNKIGIDGAECLNNLLNSTKIMTIYFDIFYSDDYGGDVKQYISWESHSHNNLRKDNITLHDNKIGVTGARYIYNTFQNKEINSLKISKSSLNQNVQCLHHAFKNVKIGSLHLHKNHITYYGIHNLVKIFEDSKIVELNLYSAKIGTAGAKYLAEFLKEIKVLKISLYYNFIRDEGVKYLVPVLKNSNIIHLNIDKNFITSEGAFFLSQVLPYSKVLYLGLCNNCIGVEGAKHLANGLPHSQVTDIHLHGNDIKNKGYRYLLNVIDKTNLTKINLHANSIDPELEGSTFSLDRVPRNSIPIASKICRIFKEIVSLNPLSNEFEFTAPTKKVDPIIKLEHYVFLIKTLHDHPNSKVHIFDAICNKDYFTFDLDAMDKINSFITVILQKFNTFIENKLPELIESFDINNNNYVNLVKQFEETSYHDIVQNLLLHRILYYIDENQEILHPYIYKMLHKYKMPLCSKELEPDKIDKIISYYQDHQEIDGTQEIIDLLRSEYCL